MPQIDKQITKRVAGNVTASLFQFIKHSRTHQYRKHKTLQSLFEAVLAYAEEGDDFDDRASLNFITKNNESYSDILAQIFLQLEFYHYDENQQKYIYTSHEIAKFLLKTGLPSAEYDQLKTQLIKNTFKELPSGTVLLRKGNFLSVLFDTENDENKDTLKLKKNIIKTLRKNKNTSGDADQLAIDLATSILNQVTAAYEDNKLQLLSANLTLIGKAYTESKCETPVQAKNIVDGYLFLRYLGPILTSASVDDNFSEHFQAVLLKTAKLIKRFGVHVTSGALPTIKISPKDSNLFGALYQSFSKQFLETYQTMFLELANLIAPPTTSTATSSSSRIITLEPTISAQSINSSDPESQPTTPPQGKNNNRIVADQTIYNHSGSDDEETSLLGNNSSSSPSNPADFWANPKLYAATGACVVLSGVAVALGLYFGNPK